MTVGGPAFPTVSLLPKNALWEGGQGRQEGLVPNHCNSNKGEIRNSLGSIESHRTHNNIPGLERGTFQMQSEMDSHKSEPEPSRLGPSCSAVSLP